MGITKARYRQATGFIRHFAVLLLDENLPVKEQNPRKWKKFIKKVCRADPIFTKFEDSWPIILYVEDWFCSLRSGHRSLSSKYKQLRDRPTSAAAARTVSVNPAPHRSSEAVVPIDTANVVIDLTHHPTASTLKQLLHTLNPDISYLSPIFEANGVGDSGAVRALANFPPSRQGIFLREDMGLTPFQFHQVQLALCSLTLAL